MRRKIVAGNWKMNKTVDEAVDLVRSLKEKLAQGPVDDVDVVVCPPFVDLVPVRDVIAGSKIGLGAQNMYWEDAGAYTGEISAGMLLSASCSYVILGHSERRQYFGETNATVNKRLKKAFAAGLTPIMCVGERLEQRQAGITQAVVEIQVREGLADITADQAKQMIIAYEPVWAIGTGVNATPEQAQEVHRFIRELLAKMFGEETAEAVRIQYGGSVKPDNAAELMSQPDVDGALVGGASLKAESFYEIVRAASQRS